MVHSKIYPNVGSDTLIKNQMIKDGIKSSQIKDIKLKDYDGSGDQIYICCNRKWLVIQV